jgi:hypothetical protein
MSAMGPRDDNASGNESVGRFLRGTITERFLLRRKEGEAPGPAVGIFAAPITVALTDPVREITVNIPGAGRGVTEVVAAVASYTITIPAITTRITENVTVIP